MAGLTSEEWKDARALASMLFVNPFLEERVELERSVLGDRSGEPGQFLTARPGRTGLELYPDLSALRERCEELLPKLRELIDGAREPSEDEWEIYEGFVFFLIYLRFTRGFESLVARSARSSGGRTDVPFWPEFERDFESLFRPCGRSLPSFRKPEVILAVHFQIERAFFHIFEKIFGGSLPSARLRAQVWKAAFTHDLRRYVRILHGRMANLSTLIVGPSGSGKELVASAVAQCGYIPFDLEERRFVAGTGSRFVAVNLSALTPTLIESELFGHIKGAFTGAVDRVGRLEECDQYGSVFLDEIGELDGSIQVKLLRVLETRRFERVGCTKPRTFAGRVIAATNRDLVAEVEAGRFRRDLYFRLCSVQLRTPSLALQLADKPDDLPDLVRFAARQALEGPTGGVGECDDLDAETEILAREVLASIEARLPVGYPWPGNFRELSQCVRNIMVLGEYLHPATRDSPPVPSPLAELIGLLEAAEVTSELLTSRYFAWVLHRRGGKYARAAETLEVDWKTVKARFDRNFYERLSGAAPK